MINVIKDILTALEGPYKWYAMMVALSLIGLIITKTMFKAVKWILIVVAIILGILVIAKFSNVIQY